MRLERASNPGQGINDAKRPTCEACARGTLMEINVLSDQKVNYAQPQAIEHPNIAVIVVLPQRPKLRLEVGVASVCNMLQDREALQLAYRQCTAVRVAVACCIIPIAASNTRPVTINGCSPSMGLPAR